MPELVSPELVASLQPRIDAFVAAHRDDPLGDVATRVRFENERVRIWELDLAPGQASALHRHDLDYLVIVLEGDLIAGVPGPQSSLPLIVARVDAGISEFVPRGATEWAFNLGTRRYREILIELKEGAS